MPVIHSSALRRSFNTQPKQISPAILDLCREINPLEQPRLVPVAPAPYGRVNECFSNVARKVELEGGSITFGWTIWEWPGVFIEAEHHGVWNDGESLLDVTPHIGGDTSILFLPDPSQAYDFETKKRRVNIRRSLGKVRAAQSHIEAWDRHNRYIEASSDGDLVHVDPIMMMKISDEITRSLLLTLVELASNKGRNDECICTSGRKFKKCCGPLIDLKAKPGSIWLAD